MDFGVEETEVYIKTGVFGTNLFEGDLVNHWNRIKARVNTKVVIELINSGNGQEKEIPN